MLIDSGQCPFLSFFRLKTLPNYFGQSLHKLEFEKDVRISGLSEIPLDHDGISVIGLYRVRTLQSDVK